MPLITDHGYEFFKDNRDAIKHMVHQPTPEWIRSFGEEYEDPRVVEDGPLVPTHEGKFVAIRDILLFAPYPTLIQHRSIVDSRSEPDDLGDRIAEQLELARQEGLTILTSNRDGKSLSVTDAGYFDISSQNGTASSVLLTGRSEHFDRVYDNGRERTADVARSALLGIFVDY